MFEEMYAVRQSEKTIFGEEWCGPESFEEYEKTLVATYPKVPGSDGNDVEIYCSASPSRFYEVTAIESENSVNEKVDGFSLSTGSGEEMAVLAVTMAKAIQQGMLSISN